MTPNPPPVGARLVAAQTPASFERLMLSPGHDYVGPVGTGRPSEALFDEPHRPFADDGHEDERHDDEHINGRDERSARKIHVDSISLRKPPLFHRARET